MGKNEDFLRELDSVAAEVESELERRRAGIAGDGTVGQLELALRELNELRELVKKGELPPKGKRWLGITWHITDSWSDNSALGERLLTLAQRYRNDLE